MFIIDTFPGSNTQRLHNVQRVRARSYVHDRIVDPAVIEADGRYVDPDDVCSTHIGVTPIDGNQDIAAFTVTPRIDGRPMKIEGYASSNILNIDSSVAVGDLSRLAVDPVYQGGKLSIAMMQVMYWCLVDMEMVYVYAGQRPAPLRLQESIGLPVERLGGKILVKEHGLDVWVTPTRIHVPSIVPSIYRKNHTFAWFFHNRLEDGLFDPDSVLHPPTEGQLAELDEHYGRQLSVVEA